MRSTLLRYLGVMAGLLLFGLVLQNLMAPAAHADVLSVLGDVVGGSVNVLSGGILGGLFRLAPEVLGVFKAKGDRDQEYRMAQLSADVAKATASAQLTEVKTTGDITYANKGLDALNAAVTAQGQKTGRAIVDFISATVRPVITYWWLALYSAVKISLLVLALNNGQSAATAVLKLWTPFDMATFGGIINFWFLDRVLKHKPI